MSFAERNRINPEKSQLLHAPCDIEGHLGSDGRLYLLDFSRLFPPVCHRGPPTQGASHLYQLLRPEFVKQHQVPLSPDIFVGFARRQPDYAECEAEVCVATHKLLTETTLNFAEWLDGKTTETIDAAAIANVVRVRSGQAPVDLSLDRVNTLMVKYLHQNGINLRYLRIVIAHLKTQFWRNVCFVEMLARASRSYLREQMQSAMQTLRMASNEREDFSLPV